MPCLACLLWTPASAAGCLREQVAQLPLRDDFGFLSVPARMGGVPMRLMLDTGSDAGLITPPAARALGLVGTARVRLEGADDGSSALPVVHAGTISLGALILRDVRLPVGALPAAPVLSPPVVGFLGGDVLSGFDLDIDVPHDRLGLWRVRPDSLACAPPPAWQGAFRTVALQAHGDRLSLMVSLDGHRLIALLDTGARSRLVSAAVAKRLGVAARTLAAEPGGVASGVGLSAQSYHWHRFQKLVIDGEVERRPVLTVAPLPGRFDMLLGTDWLARREVWVSYATRQMFFR